MDISSLALIRLILDYEIKSFDCDDRDLNDFLLNDANVHLKELLSVTYVIEDDKTNTTIAFFSILNDKITIDDVGNNNKWNRLRKLLPQRKRFRSYPAMKIGRLAVHKDYKKCGYGRAILDYLKILFITNNRTGCKFITVDAYNESLQFYEKNGFEYLTEKDIGRDTRLMFFDLKKIA